MPALWQIKFRAWAVLLLWNSVYVIKWTPCITLNINWLKNWIQELLAIYHCIHLDMNCLLTIRVATLRYNLIRPLVDNCILPNRDLNTNGKKNSLWGWEWASWGYISPFLGLITWMIPPVVLTERKSRTARCLQTTVWKPNLSPLLIKPY
jgi:hypothetical protein